jgi:hypothetical protein
MEKKPRKRTAKKAFQRRLTYILLASILLITVLYSIQLMGDDEYYETQIPADCETFPPEYRDYCWYKTSTSLHYRLLNESLKYCMKIEKPNVKAHCIIDVAQFIVLKNKGDPKGIENAELVCGLLDGGTWQSECFFKTAETIANNYQGYEHAYESCRLSEDYEYDCIGHLESIFFARDSAMAWMFCERVREDYADISETPINYCYNHYGLSLGSTGAGEACSLIGECYKAGNYSEPCIIGVLNTYKDVEAACNCPKIRVEFKEYCIK